MTTPIVTELAQALEPVTDGRFIECSARELAAAGVRCSSRGGHGSTIDGTDVKTFERREWGGPRLLPAPHVWSHDLGGWA